jgi:SAM-dependent methyltransferase
MIAPRGDLMAEADIAYAMTGMQAMRCPVCCGGMAIERHGWMLRCQACGFRGSNLQPTIGDDQMASAIDEDLRAQGLECLRRENFERLLNRLCRHIDPPEMRLLDVGCAHGWFLEAAARRGFVVTGLEPDCVLARRAGMVGHIVWPGFFPDHVPTDQRFEVLVFNDVFEHLPDVTAAAQACHARLAPEGLLVLNLPSARGVFYRLAEALDSAGVSSPLERLWQKGFPSPHLSYFDPDQLRRLMERHGLIEIDRSRLPAVTVDGLWARLRYDRSSTPTAAVAAWLGVVVATPVLRCLPGDISLQIFRRTDRQP